MTAGRGNKRKPSMLYKDRKRELKIAFKELGIEYKEEKWQVRAFYHHRFTVGNRAVEMKEKYMKDPPTELKHLKVYWLYENDKKIGKVAEGITAGKWLLGEDLSYLFEK